MTRHLRREGHVVGRKRVRRLMALMGLAPIYQRPRTTVPNLAKPLGLRPEHRVWPYLLRDVVVDHPNQVWAMDITYISMSGEPLGSTWRGFLYLAAVMDWATREVLSWRVSNTIAQRSPGGMSATPTRDVEFCLEALEEALAQHGRPGIFNTDQGSQFTSPRFTGVLLAAGVQVSMDGPGRWMDNVFIERLWRNLKYECVYLHAFETGSERRAGIEGTVAQGVRSSRLRRTPYVGHAKTHLAHLMTAAAMNLVSLLRWLANEPKAQTRHSAFARLHPLTA